MNLRAISRPVLVVLIGVILVVALGVGYQAKTSPVDSSSTIGKPETSFSPSIITTSPSMAFTNGTVSISSSTQSYSCSPTVIGGLTGSICLISVSKESFPYNASTIINSTTITYTHSYSTCTTSTLSGNVSASTTQVNCYPPPIHINEFVAISKNCTSYEFSVNVTGGNLPYSYQWTFGDNHTLQTTSNYVVHNYAVSGKYILWATASDTPETPHGPSFSDYLRAIVSIPSSTC